MARNPEYISKDLKALGATTDQVDQALRKLYSEYCDAFGKAIKRQLVLAVYQLCTQVYPDAFLRLSVSEREKVQQAVRKLAEQSLLQVEQLRQLIAVRPDDRAVESSQLQDELLDEAAPNPSSAVSEETVSSSAGTETVGIRATDIAEHLQEPQELFQRLVSSLTLLARFSAEPLSPINLAKRHVLLERHLRTILQTTSNLANYLLKQAKILPDLPEMVITAAAEAEAGEPSPNTPNLLNVLVEVGSSASQSEEDAGDVELSNPAESTEDEAESSMTHLVAVNLRLTDIEFADNHAALWRSKIQETLARLKRLGNQYQKLHREKAQAEAEFAWRAIWVEA